MPYSVLVYLWDKVPGCLHCLLGAPGACAYINGHYSSDEEFAEDMAKMIASLGRPARIVQSSIPAWTPKGD